MPDKNLSGKLSILQTFFKASKLLQFCPNLRYWLLLVPCMNLVPQDAELCLRGYRISNLFLLFPGRRRTYLNGKA